MAAAAWSAGRPAALAAQRDTVAGPLGAEMHALVSRAEAWGFGGQVLVARGGTLLLHRAYGFADRASRRPMRTTTGIGIASASKQFAAAAVQLLADAGALSLDDSVSRYVAGVPGDKRGITIRMIAEHTAGLAGGFSEYFESPSLDSAVARLLARPLRSPPGTRYAYSSEGYALLAAVVERAAGVPYERFVRERFFQPLGMRHTAFAGDLAGTDVAHAYTGWVDRGSPAEWPVDRPRAASAGVVTTAADLYRWTQALRPGGALGGSGVARLLSPGAPRAAPMQDAYAYGVFVSRDPAGGLLLEHGGDTEIGFNAVVLRYPERDETIIVLSNAMDGGGGSTRQWVQGGLARLLQGPRTAPAATPGPRRPSAALARRLEGSWALGAGRLHLVHDGAHLWAAIEGQPLLDAAAGVRDDAVAARGNARTSRLLAGLLQGEMTAYDTALGADGREHLAEYVSEWQDQVAAMGPLHGYRILGAARDGDAAVVFARLRFMRGATAMWFAWPDSAATRLRGTSIHAPAFPRILPVALTAGGLLARNPAEPEVRLTLREAPGGLELSRDGRSLGVATRVSGGWSPP